ncbi:unnamed protein product, partial [Symbiodinium natans]
NTCEHWAAPPTPYTGPTDPIHPAAAVDLSPITTAELNAALKELAHNKAAGPDSIPAEAWQWLDDHNQEALLRVLNQALLTATIPDDWHHAIVVEIYKGKGPLTDPASYRPISLLNTSYKLFAKIIHTRLQAALDDRLRETQYGFRATRSTSQPIHIVRRLIERAEATGQTLYTIFLDWEKAFDKIHPDALHTALSRYGVPPHLTALINNIYTSPQFTVAAAGKQSTREEASAGIRQGCPLSPYLFLIVHGMVMHDVDRELTAHGGSLPWLYSQNQPFYDLAYADDTALIASTAHRAEQLLHILQRIAAHSNLHLNLKKCVLLRSPTSQNTVHFHNGAPLTIEQHANTLASQLAATGLLTKTFSHVDGRLVHVDFGHAVSREPLDSVQGGRPATTIQCEELNEADIEAQLREQLQQMREQNATVEMEKAEVEARVLLLEEQVRKLSSLLSDTARQLKEAKDLPKEAEPKYKLDAGPPGTLTDEVICLQAPQLVPRLWQAARQNHQDEDAAIELDAAPSGTVAAEPAQAWAAWATAF